MLTPMLLILTGALLVLIIASLILLHHQRGLRFRCRHCGAVFQPRPLRLLFAIHASGEHRLPCPTCQKADFCVPVREQ